MSSEFIPPLTLKNISRIRSVPGYACAQKHSLLNSDTRTYRVLHFGVTPHRANFLHYLTSYGSLYDVHNLKTLIICKSSISLQFSSTNFQHPYTVKRGQLTGSLFQMLVYTLVKDQIVSILRGLWAMWSVTASYLCFRDTVAIDNM